MGESAKVACDGLGEGLPCYQDGELLICKVSSVANHTYLPTGLVVSPLAVCFWFSFLQFRLDSVAAVMCVFLFKNAILGHVHLPTPTLKRDNFF